MNDRRQARRIGRIFHGDAHDLATLHRQTVDLLQRRIGIGGIRRRHRLDDDRMIATDPHALSIELPSLVLEKNRLALAPQTQHDRLENSVPGDQARDVMHRDDHHECHEYRESGNVDDGFLLRVDRLATHEFGQDEGESPAVKRR